MRIALSARNLLSPWGFAPIGASHLSPALGERHGQESEERQVTEVLQLAP